MCGIVGHVAAPGRSPDSDAISTAMGRLRHRGPDGSNAAHFAQACFGHTRLSIIDLEHSVQPWQSEDKRYTLIFNGEIYNYVELRADLEKRGYRFRSSGDTEVLMNMFVHHGEKCLEQINGMFAFAVWDETEKSLFIARDRIGKKPLYYTMLNEGIVFASEIPALRAFTGVDLEIDLEAANDFFAYQFVNGSKSIHRGIRKLRPAHYLTYKGTKLTTRRYWSPPHPAPTTRRVVELGEELVYLLDDAVRLRLRSDVPLGAFLSGGMDSSIILATMKRLGVDVETFTVGFSEESFDERAQSNQLAQYFRTIHRDQTMDLSLPAIIDQYVNALGEPYADPSALPTWYLCKYAREHVKVALSGDGGDELFAGYRRYQGRKYIGMLIALPAWMRRNLVHRVIDLLPDTDVYYGISVSKKLKLLAHMLRRFEESPKDLLPQTYTASERKQLFKHEAAVAPVADHITEFGLEGLDPVSQMMLTDIQTYLSEDILYKVDRMSMAHSLEVRSPLLDYRIVEFACRLPMRLKINGSRQKYILREAYRSFLPENTLSRPKHGFAMPVGRWFRNELRNLFESVVLDVDGPEFLNREEIHRLWRTHLTRRVDNGLKLWSLLMFYSWYRGQL